MKLVRQVRTGLQSVVDYVFGFDFFVSYAHAADANAYVRRPRERLEQRNYKICLDQQAYHAGHDVSALTRR